MTTPDGARDQDPGGSPDPASGCPCGRTSGGGGEPAGAAADAGQDVDGQLGEQLLRLTRRIHRIQKRQLEPLGVTPAQARLLRAVAVCDRPPRMADLAARLEVVPRAVTTLVDGLEASGCARRVPDPTNRRVIRIELTSAGHDALAALRTARRSAAEEVLAPLSGEQRLTLGALLSTLVGGGRAESAPPS